MKKARSNNISITDLTNGRIEISSLPFVSIAERILGESYTLSLVFVDPKTSQELNKKYRGKDYPTDILSFPLEESEGEILICPEIAETKAPEYNRDLQNFILYLFVHGCFHLLGHEHGDEMEALEKTLREEFNI